MKKLLISSIVLICILFFTLNSFGGPTYTGSGGADGTGTDDQTAAEVVVTPAGDIAAIEVQTALEELDGEKMSTGTDTLTSAELLDTVSDETGTGAAVFGTAPTFTTSITIGTNVITEAEAGYLEDVTSSVQDQLDARISTSNDSVKSAMIDWADIGNLGEDGIATDYALTADADAGDFDVHSTDGIYGASDTEYIDMGGDLVTVVSDTLISTYSPDLRFGVDADAYLKVVTTNGGITTISQVSDGTDGITLGDGTDNIIISADNWSVDTSGNASFDGTISAAANASPYYTFLDSGNPGTDKDIARVGGNFLSGADGAEDGALLLESMLAGSQVLVGAWDSDEETWTFGDSGTGEDLIWDFETATDNQVSVSSNSGVTQIDFGSIQLNAYAKTYVASGAITVTEKSAYVICTGACQVTLPASVAGSQYYIRNAPGSATIINLVNRASQYYELTDHSAWATANQKLTSGGVATDAISIVGYDATHYATMNYTGTWTDTAP